MSFNRVLPKPLALYYDPISGREFTRRSSSLLEHKIMTADHLTQGLLSGEAVQRTDPRLESPMVVINSQASQINSSQPEARKVDNPPLGPLPRKRAATEISATSNLTRESSSKPTSAPRTAIESSTHFCLCQPDPKIPRPRNAFILYRQHYQGAVVAQNPGLANPDISKIIGELWRKLPNETKTDWKNLAEEEKARHQQQYPDYRYKPRRYGRNSVNSDSTSATSSNGSSRCSRCGGRIMATPTSSSAPFNPGIRTPAPMNVPPPTPVRYVGMGPRSPGQPTFQRVASNGYQRRDIGQPLSPDSKRRRFNQSMQFAPIRRDLQSPHPQSPYPYAQRRLSNARAEYAQVKTPRAVAIAPPPRPHRSAQSHHDGSLTLPPIQTQPLSQQNRRSVEAMVLTIPFLNKIKVLSNITPALGKPSPTSPAFAIRGAIIAIEGQDCELVKTMVTYLDSILAKTEDLIANVRIFPGPEVDTPEKNKITSPESSSSSASNMADATVQYLDVIRTWHDISNSAAQFITTPTTSLKTENSTAESDSSASISPRTILPGTENLSITSPATSTVPKPPLPVALIPRYQLTTSDYHAIRIPINDAYSPFDHWQWVATLWRGCVGPDMTIYIRECEREEYERAGGVEVRLVDASVLVVRVLKEKDGVHMGFEDRVLRRLGFEVEEWVRGRKERRFSVDRGR